MASCFGNTLGLGYIGFIYIYYMLAYNNNWGLAQTIPMSAFGIFIAFVLKWMGIYQFSRFRRLTFPIFGALAILPPIVQILLFFGFKDQIEAVFLCTFSLIFLIFFLLNAPTAGPITKAERESWGRDNDPFR